MKYFKVIHLFVCILLCRGEHNIRFDGHQIFRIIPQNVDQLQLLRKLQSTYKYDFWNGLSDVGHPVDIRIPPSLKNEFNSAIKEVQIQPKLLIPNVQSLIDDQNTESRASFLGGFGWTRYHTLNEINNWLISLEKKYPENVKVLKGGQSYKNRDILGIKISFKPGNKGAFIEGGIHAREWLSPATVTYIANELLSSNNSQVRKVAESRDWYIFPVFNPDGYVYTAIHRLWRKTRKPYGRCVGADPNRNWGYQWMQGGSSNNSCADTYAGPSAFSEIETKSLSEFISSIQDNLDAYISFHSYSQLLLIPFGDDSRITPENNDELLTIGQNSVKTLAKRYGTIYKVGNIPEVIYVASGGSVDWVKGTYQHIRITYTYELRDKGTYGFLVPPNQIIPTGEETLDSLVHIFQKADSN